MLNFLRLHCVCKVQESDEKAKLIEVQYLLKYASEYIKQHALMELQEQGILAAQMHEVVTQQLQLLCK
jgi:hypothetical protein